MKRIFEAQSWNSPEETAPRTTQPDPKGAQCRETVTNECERPKGGRTFGDRNFLLDWAANHVDGDGVRAFALLHALLQILEDHQTMVAVHQPGFRPL
jgi:hypothetical protein